VLPRHQVYRRGRRPWHHHRRPRIELVGNIDLPFFGLKDGHAGYEHVDAKVV
jgi:hypothetical protein